MFVCVCVWSGRPVSVQGGKKRQSTALKVSRPSYRFEGYIERRRKGLINRFGPILIDYDEQASCIQIK